MFKHLGKYEKPDMLSIYDNKIIAIEHFQFDSFKSYSKGSDFKWKEAQIERKFDEKVKKEYSNSKEIISTEKLLSTASLNKYYKNFIKTFKSHYSKLDSYEENIKENFDCSTKQIEYWFFIEDVSPLGSYYLNEDRSLELLNPLYGSEIKELLRNSSRIKGIFFGQYAMNKYRLSLIINSEDTFKTFENNEHSIADKDFFDIEPHTTGFAMIISKDEQGVEVDE